MVAARKCKRGYKHGTVLTQIEKRRICYLYHYHPEVSIKMNPSPLLLVILVSHVLICAKNKFPVCALVSMIIGQNILHRNLDTELHILLEHYRKEKKRPITGWHSAANY